MCPFPVFPFNAIEGLIELAEGVSTPSMVMAGGPRSVESGLRERLGGKEMRRFRCEDRPLPYTMNELSSEGLRDTWLQSCGSVSSALYIHSWTCTSHIPAYMLACVPLSYMHACLSAP